MKLGMLAHHYKRQLKDKGHYFKIYTFDITALYSFETLSKL
jgi:hypothetical protein